MGTQHQLSNGNYGLGVYPEVRRNVGQGLRVCAELKMYMNLKKIEWISRATHANLVRSLLKIS